jgi:very-short-patch-repair endonuclease
MTTSLEDLGWTIGSNLGEIKLVKAFDLARLKADEVEQQFRLGPYRLDFAAPRVYLAIEADGYHHRTEKGRWSDRRRDKQLAEWGWSTWRIDIDRDDSIETLAERFRLIRKWLDDPRHFWQQCPLPVRRRQ